jgi:hypothetical protein
MLGGADGTTGSSVGHDGGASIGGLGGPGVYSWGSFVGI